jgi:hypothetical protein
MPPEALRPATAKAAARQGRMRTRLTAGEKPNRKRMATPACVYDAEPAPRPHDVIAPPGGRHGSRTLRPKPKARAKWDGGHLRPLPDQQTGVPTLRPGPGRGLAHRHRGNRKGACRHLTATGSTSPEHDGAWTAPKPSSPCAR